MVVSVRNIIGSGLLVVTAVAVFAIAMIAKKKPPTPLTVPEPASESRAAMDHPGEFPKRTRTATTICFVRDEWIYIKDLATGKERKVAVGRVPDLSPSGEEVAFMSGKIIEDIRASSGAWRLKVLNLRTSETREFSTLADLDAWQPLWSHDGAKIAFSFLDNETFGGRLGILDVSTGRWKDISLSKSIKFLRLGSWTAGDQSILLNSLEHLYEVGVDGKLLEKIPIDNICERSEISSKTRFSLSADKRYLLFDRTVSTPEDLREIVSIYDFVTKKTSQVTPNTIDALRPLWLGPENEVMFTCITVQKEPDTKSICKIALDGSDLKILVPNADYASYAPR